MNFSSRWRVTAPPPAESAAPEAVNGGGEVEAAPACGVHEDKLPVFALAARIVDQHLSLLQKRDLREMTKVLGTPPELIQHAIDFIRSLDPRPGSDLTAPMRG